MNGALRASLTSAYISWQADVRNLFTPDALWEKLSDWADPLSKDRISTLRIVTLNMHPLWSIFESKQKKSCNGLNFFQETNTKQ